MMVISGIMLGLSGMLEMLGMWGMSYYTSQNNILQNTTKLATIINQTTFNWSRILYFCTCWERTPTMEYGTQVANEKGCSFCGQLHGTS